MGLQANGEANECDSSPPVCLSDPRALEHVSQRYHPALLAVGLKSGFSVEQSEELAQRVWMTFLEVLPRFRGASQVKTFLFGIFYRKAHEMRRELKRERHRYTSPSLAQEAHGGLAAGNVELSESPESLYLKEEKKSSLRKALNRLTHLQKKVYWLSEIENKSQDDICHYLDISQVHYRVLLHRARKKLQNHERGDAHGGYSPYLANSATRGA